MIRPLLRIAVWLTLLFMVVTAFIHIQPYDDSALRTILRSSDCTMPCFMGIRPGETTCDEAVAVLGSHLWIGEIRLNECPIRLSSGTAFIVWTWSGQQPAYIRAAPRPLPNIRVEDGIVREITVETSIPLGDVWLLYGTPNYGIVDVIGVPGGNGYITQILNGNAYPEMGLAITSYAPCPTTFEAFWNAPTEMLFSSNLQSRAMTMDQFAALLKYHNHLCRG